MRDVSDTSLSSRGCDTSSRGEVNPLKQQSAIKGIIANSTTSYTVIPGYVSWKVPEEEHTDECPFCPHIDSCMCHFDSARMEKYFIGPIERGELSIVDAIDLYHAEPGYMARQQAEALEREAVLL